MICTLQPCHRGLGGGAQNTTAPRSSAMQPSVWWLVGMELAVGVACVLGIGTMSVLPSLFMDEPLKRTSEDCLRVSLEMPMDLMLWLDQIKGELGLRSRGELVVKLLQEIRGETSVKVD